MVLFLYIWGEVLSNSMNDTMGVIVNEHTLRIERLLPGPIECVFDYFTDSDLLESWLMPGSVEKKEGGLIEFVSPPVPEGLVENVRAYSEDVFSCGLVSKYEPPNLLVYSWNEHVYDTTSIFKIQLEERDEKVYLVLTHSHLGSEWMAVTATGWHVSLHVLHAILNGEEIPDTTQLFSKLLAEYKVLIAGAGIVVVATTASPAMAQGISDSAYKQIKSQKHELLVKYDVLWKDTKDINKNIARLEKASNRDAKAIDSLYRDLNDKKKDMRNIELDVRDLDKVLK